MKKYRLPEWARGFVLSDARYKVAYGGRGSSKSTSLCMMLLDAGRKKRLRILACREIQTSIKSSVHQLMRNIIYDYGTEREWKITASDIKHLETGTHISFAGLKNNPENVKSTEGIDICFIEEAQTISADSMQLLIPTVRKPGSQIWMAMNPRYSTDYIYQRFIVDGGDNVYKAKVNHQDNPWFPDVLRQEMEYDKEHDHELYRHTWNGELRPHGERPLFSADSLGKGGPELFGEPTLYGLDLSWSGDNAITSISESESGHELFIHSAELKSKIPLKRLKDWLGGIDKMIVTDSARPEVIALLRDEGYEVKASRKGAGSVAKGADRMARYDKIWFADGCDEALQEFSELGFSEDDELVGKRDCFDSVRYALERIGGGLKTISWAEL